MSVKPILFDTDMTQAILDGRKTATRRVVEFDRKGGYGLLNLIGVKNR